MNATRFSVGLAALLLLPASPGWAQCDAPIDLGRGPINFHVPESYDATEAAPLVILLHGRGTNGRQQELYMGFTPAADRHGYLFAYPDATPDPQGVLTWNGTDACCDFGRTNVDDSGYLADLVDAIEAQCNVDPRKIYFTGHSNGGFMSFRMACDHADRVAAIASLAGATFLDPDDCQPSEAVHSLAIHGTDDRTIRYDGGANAGVFYPSAIETAEIWADYNRCSSDPLPDPTLRDLDDDVDGTETNSARYAQACRAGGSSELWTIEGGGHAPALLPSYAESVSEYLLAHPKTTTCEGAERVKARRCTAANKLVLKLRGGLPGDGYRVELSSGESRYGTLNAKGKTKVKLKGLPDAEGTASITFGCGEVVTKSFDCS